LESLGINKHFWKGKKVLVTGHTGFKGSWLSLWLQSLGAEVVGVSLDPPTKKSLYEQANVAKGMISLREDIRNGEEIKKIFHKYQPEIVFHLAAQSLVRYSYQNPVETYETNVMGTLHVLEGIRSVKSVRSAVMVTTDKCYENKEWEWGYRENEPMGGHDPYSSSKGSSELLISSYRESYYPINEYNKHKTSIASVRAGNVIGGGDWADDRIIPDIIRAFQQGKKVEIRNPNSIRPWQHVLEPLSGYIKLAGLLIDDAGKYTGAWNFGPNDKDARPVQWIVEKVSEQWGCNEECWVFDKGEHPHEAHYLKLDCSKAKERIGWSPKWNLSEALLKIVEWHKLEHSGNDCRKICLTQINDYIARMEK
jgi:CDP-glucose 4,6-dehydratase